MKGTIHQRAPGVFLIAVDHGRDAKGKRVRRWTTFRGIKRQVQDECARPITIWLQYAQANIRSQQCARSKCPKRFLVGAVAGRRADTAYCSQECRVKFNSLKRSQR
jgi:hypothetical protein